MAVRTREIAFLTEPAARRHGAAGTRAAVARLRDAGFGVRLLDARDGDEARDLAHAAVADEVDAVVACGDDGVVHRALQAVAGTPVALGVVPLGARDDAARVLGLPRRDPLAAADRVVATRTRTVDLGRVGQQWFLTRLVAGAATLPALATAEPRTCTLDLDGATRRTTTVLVVVGNAGPAARLDGRLLDDGRLDVVVVHPGPRRRTLAACARLRRGTTTAVPGLEHHRAARVTVAVAGLTAHADGEFVGPLPLTVACVPRALTVLA